MVICLRFWQLVDGWSPSDSHSIQHSDLSKTAPNYLLYTEGMDIVGFLGAASVGQARFSFVSNTRVDLCGQSTSFTD
jgi:hypothetical protein